MTTLHARLLRAEDDFLSAVSMDESAMEAFYEGWEILCRDVATGIEDSTLDDDTINLAYMVSSQIEIFADSFQDLFMVADASYADMTNELVETFAELTLGSPEEDDTFLGEWCHGSVLYGGHRSPSSSMSCS